LESAKRGKFDEIPSDVVIRCYPNLKRIHVDSLKPDAIEKEVFVFWGATGTGKSKRAWEEATLEAYPKDPNTKFWDGYNGQENVVIDEFRGLISISHMLRWLDRYPVIVEIKGSSCVLKAKKIWITSNLSPDDWYKELDSETLSALRRRLNITHFFYFFLFFSRLARTSVPSAAISPRSPCGGPPRPPHLRGGEAYPYEMYYLCIFNIHSRIKIQISNFNKI